MKLIPAIANLTKRYSKKKLTLLLILLSGVGSACNVLLPPPENLVPADEIREDISLEEAQRLFPVAICLPAYLPSGIESTPRIVYHADFGDPQDSELRLRYYRSSGNELALEVYEMPWPGVSNVDLNKSEYTRQLAIRDLLAWMVGWPKVDEIKVQVNSQATKYRDDLDRWLFQIIEPDSLRSNVIEWGNDPVLYRVYTRLSTDEAKRVAKSITDCMMKPTATP
jgi:hypothetical protein